MKTLIGETRAGRDDGRAKLVAKKEAFKTLEMTAELGADEVTYESVGRAHPTSRKPTSQLVASAPRTQPS